jgi:O-antigen/teichoic acid export membrane protein
MSLFKSLTTTFLFRVVVIITSMITGIILARTLGPEGRGEWALILLNIVLLTLVANLGTPEASIYFIGQKKYLEQEIISTLITYSITIVLIIISLNILLFKLQLNIFLNKYDTNVVYLVSFIILPQALNTQIRHFLLGKKEVLAYNLLVMYESVLFTLAISALALLSFVSVYSVITVYLVVNIISFIIHAYNLRQIVSLKKIFSSFNSQILKACLKNGSSYFFTGMGGFWSHRLNYLFLELFHSTNDIGLYTVALAIPNLIANIPNQISLVLYPYISAIKKKGDAVELTSVILKVSIVIILISSFPIIFYGDTIIQKFYGEEYSGLYAPLLILFAAMAFDGIGSLLFNYFAGRGKPILGSYKFIISISALLLGGFLIIPQFGIEGAALSKCLSAFSASLFMLYLFIRENGLLNSILIRMKDIHLLKQILRQEI